MIYAMVREAVDIEKEFINIALPCSLLGMNATMMAQYIEFCADRLIIQLGYKSIYNASNPFPFMDNIGIEALTNFFERRSSVYVSNTSQHDKQNVDYDADF
jgi:ribonucleotide reductase beta subunit family protein with ferritin-like domain